MYLIKWFGNNFGECAVGAIVVLLKTLRKSGLISSDIPRASVFHFFHLIFQWLFLAVFRVLCKSLFFQGVRFYILYEIIVFRLLYKILEHFFLSQYV